MTLLTSLKAALVKRLPGISRSCSVTSLKKVLRHHALIGVEEIVVSMALFSSDGFPLHFALCCHLLILDEAKPDSLQLQNNSFLSFFKSALFLRAQSRHYGTLSSHAPP